MTHKPYVLVLGSHKGGTGRTTCALALAWTWGRGGLRVALVDADHSRSAALVAQDASGQCPWKNVRFFSDLPADAADLAGCDIILIDCPALTERAAQRVLRLADGIVLTCLAEPLSLRTIPAATAAIRTARQTNPRLQLLGMLIGIHNELDEFQAEMLSQLRRQQPELLLEPVVPYQQEVCDWALRPGSDLPPGPARDAFETLALSLEPHLGQLQTA